MASNRRHPPKRFLPLQLKHESWFQVDDPTAVAMDDWIYDPAEPCNYAGQIISIQDNLIKICWHKSENNRIIEWLQIDQLIEMWWIDPVMQYV